MKYDNIVMLISLFLFFIIVIYLYLFFVIYSSRYKKSNQLADYSFYRILKSIYEQNLTIEKAYNQLLIDYYIHIKYTQIKNRNIQDALERIIYCFDAYNDTKFARLFREEKNSDIRTFINEILDYINNNYPFTKAPQKEASLLKIIKESLENGNTDLGINGLNQLSEEIEIKEKVNDKLESQNRKSYIISVVGIILTIFFGILSFLKL